MGVLNEKRCKNIEPSLEFLDRHKDVGKYYRLKRITSTSDLGMRDSLKKHTK